MMRQDMRAFVWLVAGFTVWAGAFVCLYAVQALGCAYDWPFHRGMLIAFYIISLLPLAFLAWRRPSGTKEPATGLAVAALWANRAAFGAGVLVFLPVTFASACV